MPWSEADRRKYDVVRERYSSDLSDAEFALIFPLLPAPKRRGRRPRCACEILNALFYLIRSGCPWRLLPKDFPPFHDSAEPVLRLARQRIIDPNRLRPGDGRKGGGGPRRSADGGGDRQSIGQDDGGWRAARLRRRQENQGPQAPCRRRYARPSNRMPGHASRHPGPRRPSARLTRGAPQEPVRDDVFRQFRL